MDMSKALVVLAMLAILALPGCTGTAQEGNSTVQKANVSMVVYYGIGCPHCSNMITVLNDLQKSTNFTMDLKEIRYDPANRAELMDQYQSFGYDSAQGGIPTTVINGKMLVVGEFSRNATAELLRLCQESECPTGAYTSVQAEELMDNIMKGMNVSYSMQQAANVTGSGNVSSSGNNGDIPLMILVPAAIADSINPCTMAIMAMLLAITLEKSGKKNVLVSGIVFTAVIFICYLLMGIGVMKIVGDISIQKYFFYFMLIVSAAITALEIKSFFWYRPGMEAIEIPLFLRPHLQKVMAMATSLPMVAAVAVFCSLFLLPCSSGPYLMILSMLSLTDMWTTQFFKAMGYLVIYNLIFVVPLIAITAIVAFGVRNPGDILSLRDKYVKQMHLIAGLLMLLVTVVLAAFIFNGALFR